MWFNPNQQLYLDIFWFVWSYLDQLKSYCTEILNCSKSIRNKWKRIESRYNHEITRKTGNTNISRASFKHQFSSVISFSVWLFYRQQKREKFFFEFPSYLQAFLTRSPFVVNTSENSETYKATHFEFYSPKKFQVLQKRDVFRLDFWRHFE